MLLFFLCIFSLYSPLTVQIFMIGQFLLLTVELWFLFIGDVIMLYCPFGLVCLSCLSFHLALSYFKSSFTFISLFFSSCLYSIHLRTFILLFLIPTQSLSIHDPWRPPVPSYRGHQHSLNPIQDIRFPSMCRIILPLILRRRQRNTVRKDVTVEQELVVWYLQIEWIDSMDGGGW